MRVRVYKNLHKNCYSVKSMEGRFKNIVIAHAYVVSLSNVKFIVYEKGRQRVLREQRKNVHAFVEGDLETIVPVNGKFDYPLFSDKQQLCQCAVTYNPYKYEYFYKRCDSSVIFSSSYVTLGDKGIAVYE